MEIAIDPVVAAYDLTFPPASRTDTRSNQVKFLNYLAEDHGLKDINSDLSMQRQLRCYAAEMWESKNERRYKTHTIE